MKLLTKVCVTFSLGIVSSLVSRANIPDGPQGPSGAILKVKLRCKRNMEKIYNHTAQYDLLSNSQPGINYPGTHIGAFVAQDWPPGVVNDEDQAYVPEAATQVRPGDKNRHPGYYNEGGLFTFTKEDLKQEGSTFCVSHNLT